MADQRCRTANCPNRQAGSKCPEHGGPSPELAATPEPEEASSSAELVPMTATDPLAPKGRWATRRAAPNDQASDSPAVE